MRDIQSQNEQIDNQLNRVRTVGHLILNDKDHTFKFETTDANGVPETCDGKYEVHGDLAQIVGDLLCSQTVTVGPGK